MGEMVERVARALFHAECEPHKSTTGYSTIFSWEDVMPAVKDRHMANARAAIEAMREPTGKMKNAACDIGPDTNCGAFDYDNATDVYQAMIDAALK